MDQPFYFTSSDNKKISYYKRGNGDIPFVVLHGLCFNGMISFKTIDFKLKNISTYYIDLPGHGNSTSLVLNTEEEWINILIDFCKSLNSRYIVLSGFSLGGWFALKVSEKLLKQGYKVSLYMRSTPLKLNGKTSVTVLANTLMTYGRYAYPLMRYPFMRKVLELIKMDLNTDACESIVNINPYVFRFAKEILNKDLTIDGSNIDFKYIYGDRDVFVNNNRMISELEKIKPKSLVYISGSQHFGNWDGWMNSVKYIAENESTKIRNLI